MRATYDEEADAAYITLVSAIEAGESMRQAVVAAEGLRAEIVFDFDDEDRLIGIEILGASSQLRGEALQSFVQLP